MRKCAQPSPLGVTIGKGGLSCNIMARCSAALTKTSRRYEWFRRCEHDKARGGDRRGPGLDDSRDDQRGLIRAEPGWPGTLKRLPVSVTLVPSMRRMEKSLST